MTDGLLENRLVVLPRRTYCAVMSSRTLTVTFDAHDPTRLAQFWAGLLGREVVEDSGGALLPVTTPRSASGSPRAARIRWSRPAGCTCT